ncbi:hypothetical protein CLU79DRAFT_732847 [Phycomyces nitens]|nr:hypothetical protein CLU79DRAFT_732847 [Phycomyces nitens]
MRTRAYLFCASAAQSGDSTLSKIYMWIYIFAGHVNWALPSQCPQGYYIIFLITNIHS